MRLTLVVFLCATVLASCAGPAPVRRTVEFSGPSMGTTWTVKVVTGADGLTGDESRAVDRGIRDELARIDRLMSTWSPESELSRFNASSSLEPFPVAPETFDVFQWSARIWSETEGVFDPTLGPLIDAWGFGADKSVPTPDDETVERLRTSVGMALIELDPDGRWVRKRAPGVGCEFAGIAPGYAADKLAAQLEARGLTDFLIDVSGELVARGRNEHGIAWQVGVERPQAGAEGRQAVRVVPLTDQAMATSGDYRNFREVNGVRYSHTLDPRTGRPVAHALASVTVVDALAVRADALATALIVLGPDEGMAYAERHATAVLFLIRQPDGSFEERRSPAFETLMAGSTGAGKVGP